MAMFNSYVSLPEGIYGRYGWVWGFNQRTVGDLILEELVIVQHMGIFIEPAIDGISGIVRSFSKYPNS